MSTDSLLKFELPSIGEGVESADVADVLVEVGETVSKDQVLMELETEKAVVELPCPADGTVKAIHCGTGDAIAVGQHIMDIDTGGGGGGESAPSDDAPVSGASSDAPAAEKSESSGDPAPASASSGGSGGDHGSSDGDVTDFPLPEIGEGVQSADIAEILVAAGDTVEAGQIIMELETEKAVVELPIKLGGTIAELLVGEGDTVDVGQPILRIASGASAPSAKSDDPNLGVAQPAGEREAGRDVSTSHERRVPDAQRAMADDGATAGTNRLPAVSGGSGSGNGQAETNGQAAGDDAIPAPAAPSTRRLARQLGVNLRSVKGSGPGGRITKDDVQAHVKAELSSPSRNLPATAGGGGGQIALAPPPLPDFSKFGQTEREKMGKLSRTAAENLTTAWHVIPHVTQQDLADITDIEAARKSFAKGPGANGPKVTMTAIAMKTLATCLQAFPKFNSSLDPETFELVFKRYYHIGCAVDTPNGLLVPVIRDCDQKSILEIAAELTELAGKARDRKLSPDSMQGATCTVTNLGGIGGTGFTPIVNYPEVAILGMSRGEKRLQMRDGQVVERMLLPLSLSYDHRVINGADAAKFLVMFKNMLQDPFSLLAAV